MDKTQLESVPFVGQMIFSFGRSGILLKPETDSSHDTAGVVSVVFLSVLDGYLCERLSPREGK